MRVFICIFAILEIFSATNSIAQINLVNNPSFEDFSICPTGVSQINLSTGWNNIGGSPDYFNACALYASGFSVPENVFGFHFAASGHAYAGFYAKDESSGYREFAGTLLSSPMQIGTEYFISLKVSLSTYPYRTEYCGVNKIGVLFSTSPYSSINQPSVNNFANIYTNQIIIDTLNWVMIKGSFIADSNYTFLSIGNFFADSLTDSIQVVGIECHAYYFLDDVCISSDSSYCNSFSVGEIYGNINANISVYPNPADNFIFVDFPNLDGTYDLIIYNIYGIELFAKSNIDESNLQIPIKNINEKMIVIKINYKNSFLIQKILKIRP